MGRGRPGRRQRRPGASCASRSALWNGADPILKERLFGLTNTEGNHGEDVKEYYFYVDNMPTHSWMRWRYKYPQTAYPYDDLVRTNRERGSDDQEYELLDTGVFDDGRYFDVQVDYAKAGPTDLLARITVHNRSAEAAPLHLLPTLWFRNTWSRGEQSAKPTLDGGRRGCPRASPPNTHGSATTGSTSARTPTCSSARTRPTPNACGASRTRRPSSRTGSTGRSSTARPMPSTPRAGTKVAAHWQARSPAGEEVVLELRLTTTAAGERPTRSRTSTP